MNVDLIADIIFWSLIVVGIVTTLFWPLSVRQWKRWMGDKDE
jgi:hypothetical protein